MEDFKKKNSKEKIDYIFSELEKGVDRDTISRKMGYKNYKSLDIFVRRQGYTWEARLGKYLLPGERKSGRYAKVDSSLDGKLNEILRLFSKKDLDAKEIAVKVGFSDHRELALYMKTRGYKWDSSIWNYYLEDVEDTKIAHPNLTPREEEVLEDESVQELDDESVQELDDDMIFTRYKKILDYILDKEETLKELLNEKCAIDSERSLPRFTIPGIFVTKSVHMTNQLSQLVKDFSDDRNISQRDIFEIALVEFFQKYGYRKEIDVLLQQK